MGVLYDLTADPVESSNMLPRQPDRLAAMRTGLETWLGFVARSLNGADYRP